MKSKKMVIIRGLVTAGKTTTSYELAKVLPNYIFIDQWKIKEMFEPLGLGLKDRIILKTASKKAMIVIMREVIRELGINIIVQESSRSFLNKYLGKDIKKYKYKIYSFYLEIDLKNAIKRDMQREKPTMNLSKYSSEEEWLKTRVKPERNDIIINTSKNDIKTVVNIILKNIKEKRKSHPRAHYIRKSW